MIYVYIDGNGQTGTSTKPPTDADKISIADGWLQVVCFHSRENGHGYSTPERVHGIDEHGEEYDLETAEYRPGTGPHHRIPQ